jgi:hypothetical protein
MRGRDSCGRGACRPLPNAVERDKKCIQNFKSQDLKKWDHILIFTYLKSRGEDSFSTKSFQAFPEFNLLLNSS